MNPSVMSLKARINQYAREKGLPAQVVLQNFMFHRFLERLASSRHRDGFVVKGGMLISSLVGLDTRATMDLDMTCQGMDLRQDVLAEAIQDICQVDVLDGVRLEAGRLEAIRRDDPYGGLRVRVQGTFHEISTPLFIDITTGDVITPAPVLQEFFCPFRENVKFSLLGYPVETILAEKTEAILSRGVFSTRPRDYYDLHILHRSQPYIRFLYQKALRATAAHRGTLESIFPWEPVVIQIEESEPLRQQWSKYQAKFSYARGIPYEALMESLKEILGS